MGQDKSKNLGEASRRGFIKALGIGAAQVAVPVTIAPVVQARTVTPVVVLPESRIAGAEKRLSVEARLALEKGNRLVFRREPDNRWDKRAVSIHLVDATGAAGEAIGYVPRHENTMICDLLDAGHDIAGELLESERFELHNKVAPGSEPSPEMRFIEDVKLTEDGSRIIKVECIRPQFRAWIATGQIATARPPEWFEIPDEPDWIRIVRQHKPTQMGYWRCKLACPNGKLIWMHWPCKRTYLASQDWTMTGKCCASLGDMLKPAKTQKIRQMMTVFAWWLGVNAMLRRMPTLTKYNGCAGNLPL